MTSVVSLVEEWLLFESQKGSLTTLVSSPGRRGKLPLIFHEATIGDFT